MEEMEGGEEQLNKFVVGSLPTLIYIPDFISDSEQIHLLQHIYRVPISKWKSLKNRMLQNWGGVVHEKGLLPQDLPSWLTEITKRICQQTGLFPSPINHVLINEYLPDQGIMPHQDGPAYFPIVAILSLGSPAVMDFTPHSRLIESYNKETETGKEAILSLGSSVLLMPCSLLIFKDEAYSDYLHGIEDSNRHRLDKIVNISEGLKQSGNTIPHSLEVEVETQETKQQKSIQRTMTRVSLTCRLVLKVHRNLFKI